MLVRSTHPLYAITILLVLVLASCTNATTTSLMEDMHESIEDPTYTPLPTYTPNPTHTPQPKASSTPVELLEEAALPDPTASIDQVALTAPTEGLSEHLKVYTDPKTNVSLSYPADWELEEHEDDVVFLYPDGDVFFHIMDAPFDELEETAEEIFSEYDYIEETRLAIDSPSGYFSVGEMRDGASHARVIIGDQEFGLIILGATSNPENFEKHLELFQMMLSTLEIPGEPKAILTFDNESLCVTSSNSDLPRFDAPMGSTTSRCSVTAGNVVIDFTAYPGVLDGIYKDVVTSIFHASELFPIPVDAFDGTAQVMVAIWHRSKSDLVQVADHRCSYSAPGSEMCLLDLMRPWGIGMAKLSNDPLMFEVVWPSDDQHIDRDVTHWLPAAHEWFHVYQNAHTVKSPLAIPGPDNIPLAGPVWLDEGLADFVGAIISDHVGEVDFVSTLTLLFHHTHDRYTMSTGVAGADVLPNCSTPSSQIQAEESGNAWQCPAGPVAITHLLYLAGDGRIERIKSYYRDLATLGWETSFAQSFGRTPEVFYEEFGEFLDQPIEQQTSIISKPIFESPAQTDVDQPTEINETVEYDGTGIIDIVNIAGVSTTELEEWASFADSKMASRHANILAVLWPVGDFVREGGFDHPFNQHEVLITEEEVDFLLDEIDIWLSDQTCMKDDPQLHSDELEIYSDWMTRGADASTQLDLCPGTRLVMMGLTPNHQNQTAWGRRDLQVFFVHELYHAFQQDLADEWCRQQTDSRPRRDSNSPWIIEGGAAYFAEFVVSEINGESTPKSNVLRNAFNAFRDEGTDIFQGAIDITGAAALQLMVEQGHIDQADILDGSLFHDCAREKEYGNDNPYVVASKNSWHLIEEQGGVYVFSEAAFNH